MSRPDRPAVPWYRSNLFIASLLFIATVAAYQHVTECQFINFDDDTYVEKNPNVQAGLNGQNLWWSLTSTESANWHPLTWMSLQLNAAIQGHRPAGYHLTNLLIHAANTVLLFLVLRRMTQAVWRSAAVAALFGLHPIHVESVAWIFERKDVLSTFFFIVAIGAYIRFVEQPSHGRYTLVVVAFALGIVSKPMVVTLPCVLLLLDYWPLERIGSETGIPSAARLLREKLPLFALSVLCSLITLYAQQIALRTSEEYPFFERLANAANAYVGYIGRTFWPVHLSFFYPYHHDASWWQPMCAVLLLAGTTVFAALGRRRRYLFTGWVWYLGTLVPVIGIVQVGVQALADRYMYIPSIGLFILVVWGSYDLYCLLPSTVWLRPVARSFGLVACALILFFCAWLTRLQVEHWRTSWTLWENALDVEPGNYLAHRMLAFLYLDLHKKELEEEAIRHLRLAIDSNPYDEKSYTFLADILQKQNKLGQAMEVWKEGLRRSPNQAEWHHNLGVNLLESDPDRGLDELLQAVRLKPDLALTHLVLARELERRGRRDEAALHLDKARSLMSGPRQRGGQ
jgi:tetratricopeptide (TPR) repeat protein